MISVRKNIGMQVTFFEKFVHGSRVKLLFINCHKLTPEIKVAANLRGIRDQEKETFNPNFEA